ncbi:unnamed protein product [Acanthosepion pharaonis]|uniref:Tube Death domain-containing protein n=1 Tax=Acanthosepion pharaonis TaxID=158019 RepID=A0A812CEI8_ACAPH|nr:unnamed protein product [Sepia pharaonis]
MENIPQYLDDPNSPLRYTAQDGLNIRTKSQQKGRSPTVLLLEDWSTQNPQIHHLIEALKKSELYAAADYLSVSVLKGTEPPAENKSFSSCDGCQKHTCGKPAEHNESSSSTKWRTGNEHTQMKPCLSLTESINSREDVKSLPLVGSAPPPTPVNDQKCKATENDEMDEVKKTFKMIAIESGHCPRIAYNILSEMTDNFNDKDVFYGGRLLGSGGFGSVYLGVKSGLKVAVKRLFDTTDEQTKLFEKIVFLISKYLYHLIYQVQKKKEND